MKEVQASLNSFNVNNKRIRLSYNGTDVHNVPVNCTQIYILKGNSACNKDFNILIMLDPPAEARIKTVRIRQLQLNR